MVVAVIGLSNLSDPAMYDPLMPSPAGEGQVFFHTLEEIAQLLIFFFYVVSGL